MQVQLDRHKHSLCLNTSIISCARRGSYHYLSSKKDGGVLGDPQVHQALLDLANGEAVQPLVAQAEGHHVLVTLRSHWLVLQQPKTNKISKLELLKL